VGCPEFNLVDAFNMLDLHGKGFITAPILLEALELHGLSCHRSDIATFLVNYDSDSDGRLLYSDICDALTPKDRHLARELTQRHSKYIHSGIPRDSFFDKFTRNKIMDCLSVLFESEE
jgi:hypothetical protein